MSTLLLLAGHLLTRMSEQAVQAASGALWTVHCGALNKVEHTPMLQQRHL